MQFYCLAYAWVKDFVSISIVRYAYLGLLVRSQNMKNQHLHPKVKVLVISVRHSITYPIMANCTDALMTGRPKITLLMLGRLLLAVPIFRRVRTSAFARDTMADPVT